MDPESWERVRGVFERAAEADASEREAVLDRECGSDAELRAAAETLLRAQARADRADFLGSPAEIPQPTAPGSGSEAAPEPPPARIGPYRILRELGHGGMGAVYLGERDEPGLRRPVAVKVVRPGRASALVVERFRTERQILAALEHPGIARLYDGGTEAAQPYFVMEYVAGEGLLSWCNRRQLPVEARLRLFRQVCDAVQYAHQHLVVHRDLKPSNILVSEAGEPKLLDFGIAKLLNPAGEDEEPGETTGLQLMTPAYASPEQVLGQRVTAASDVYSLGVVLYELLCGRRPRRAGDRSADPFDPLQLDDEPLPPSLALSQPVPAAEPSAARPVAPERLAELRGTTPRRLARRLSGDLDTVVLKALRRQPADRYATVAELSEDLGRHATGHPIRARPATRAQRTLKFVRRNRASVVAAAVAVLSLVAGAVVASVQARVADAERRRAQARFEDVRRLANSVIYELHDAIQNLPGATPARRLLVTRALEYLDSLAAEAGGDLDLQRELAAGYGRLSRVQGGSYGANLGDTSGALASQEKALAIQQRLAARRPPAREDVLQLAMLEFERGTLLRATAAADEAEQAFLSSAGRLESLLASAPLPEQQTGQLGAVYQRLAEAQFFLGKYPAAERSAQRAVAEAEQAFARRPEDATRRAVLASSLHQLAEALASAGHLDQALGHTRRSRELLETGLQANPLDARLTRVLLFALNGESHYLRRLGDLSGAERVRARALEIADQALRRDPSDRWSQMGVAIAAKELAAVLVEVGRTGAALPHYRRAVAICRRVAAEDPDSQFAQLELASAEYGLARALLGARAGPHATACATLRRVDAFWTRLASAGQLPPAEAAEREDLSGWLARCPA